MSFWPFRRFSLLRSVGSSWSANTAPVRASGCWYCKAVDHLDNPCPNRVRDAYRFAVQGAQQYPPVAAMPADAHQVVGDLRRLEQHMLVVAGNLAVLPGFGEAPMERAGDLAGAAAAIGEWARQIELGREGGGA